MPDISVKTASKFSFLAIRRFLVKRGGMQSLTSASLYKCEIAKSGHALALAALALPSLTKNFLN